jgi:hypothetical protein
VIWSDELSFTLFPASGRVYVWRTPKEAHNPACLVPTVRHWGGYVMVWAAISGYSILLVTLLSFMAKLLQEIVHYYSLFTSHPLFNLAIEITDKYSMQRNNKNKKKNESSILYRVKEGRSIVNNFDEAKNEINMQRRMYRIEDL